jgi:hypothetical protein
MGDKFAYRIGSEDYFHGGFDSREEAVDEAVEQLGDEDTYEIGKAVPFTIEQSLPTTFVESLFGRMNTIAYVACDELVDSWPNDINIPEPELKVANETIKKTIVDLLTKHNCHPPCFRVVDIEEHRCPQTAE